MKDEYILNCEEQCEEINRDDEYDYYPYGYFSRSKRRYKDKDDEENGVKVGVDYPATMGGKVW